MLTQEHLEQITRSLVHAFNPVEIYLFGSYAWGKPDEESDVDLLVVVDYCDPKDRYKEMEKGHRVLLNVKGVAKEIMVMGKEEFEKASTHPWRIFHRIKEQGKVVYARA